MRSYIDTTKQNRSATSSSKPEVSCLADLFLRHVAGRVGQVALIMPRRAGTGRWIEDEYTFGELRNLVFKYQHALLREGFTAGDRVLILAPVQVELYSVFYAMCSIGVVPVFIDTSVGARLFLRLLQKSKVRAIVSTPAFHRLRWLAPSLRAYPRYTLADSGHGFTNLQDLFPDNGGTVSTNKAHPEDAVLITYTTGSTGEPKGADRAHAILYNQYRCSRLHWPEEPGEVDMPWFPMVAFQNLNCGIKTILPATDFRRIDDFEPAEVLEQIRRAGVTRMSAPPSVYQKLCTHMLREQVSTLSLRRLIVGGAPVSKKLASLIRSAFPGVEAHVVYGSTEAEPISFVSIDETLREPADAYLVGKPIPEIQVRVCRFGEVARAKVATGGIDSIVTSGVGEIVLAGPHVIKRYLDNDEADRTTKIPDPEGRIWHRTGDLGFFDHLGRIWLVGRVHDGACYGIEHRSELLAGVVRAALTEDRLYIQVGDGADWQYIKQACERLFIELGVPGRPIVKRRSMPLDRRHRWKIDRKKLPAG